mgnify:FL=1|jgi:hypothetical protein
MAPEEQQAFTIKKGDTIVIPKGVTRYFHDSDSGDKEANETPILARLQETKDPDKFVFATKKTEHGKILFLPKGLKIGNEVTVLWADKNCVCANKA